MKRFFLMDAWGVDRITTNATTQADAEKHFYNVYGYRADVVKEIDEMGGTVRTLRDLRK